MKTKTGFIVFLLALMVLMGCEDKKKKEQPKPKPVEEVKLEKVDPIDTTTVQLDDLGLPIEAQVLNDSTYIFQGDIMIPIDQNITEPLPAGAEIPREKAAARTKGLWPNNTMYYQIRSDVPEATVEKINEAMRIWAENTNVKFVDGKGPDGSHVVFYPGSGCSSYVGKVGGPQLLSVKSTCKVGNIMHEIAHALGFWHEQSRADRDNFVKIHYENIKPGYVHNFRTYADTRMDGQELSAELDFGSIMMYPSTAFTKNGKPTITKLDGSRYSTQRRAPSEMDFAAMRMLYPETLPEEEGYVNGRLYFLLNCYVLRQNDAWWFYTKWGYKEVHVKRNYWFYK